MKKTIEEKNKCITELKTKIVSFSLKVSLPLYYSWATTISLPILFLAVGIHTIKLSFYMYVHREPMLAIFRRSWWMRKRRPYKPKERLNDCSHSSNLHKKNRLLKTSWLRNCKSKSYKPYTFFNKSFLSPFCFSLTTIGECYYFLLLKTKNVSFLVKNFHFLSFGFCPLASLLWSHSSFTFFFVHSFHVQSFLYRVTPLLLLDKISCCWPCPPAGVSKSADICCHDKKWTDSALENSDFTGPGCFVF